MSEDKEQDANVMAKGLPLGIGVGMSFGLLFSTLTDNFALLALGPAFGIGMAPLFGQMLLKKEAESKDDEA